MGVHRKSHTHELHRTCERKAGHFLMSTRNSLYRSDFPMQILNTKVKFTLKPLGWMEDPLHFSLKIFQVFGAVTKSRFLSLSIYPEHCQQAVHALAYYWSNAIKIENNRWQYLLASMTCKGPCHLQSAAISTINTFLLSHMAVFRAWIQYVYRTQCTSNSGMCPTLQKHVCHDVLLKFTGVSCEPGWPLSMQHVWHTRIWCSFILNCSSLNLSAQLQNDNMTLGSFA